MKGIKKPANLDDLRLGVQTILAEFQKSFEHPEDDWPNAMFFWHNPEDGVNVMEIPNFMFANHESKNIVANILKTILVTEDVVRFVLCMNVHGVRTQPDDETMERVNREEIRIQQLPGAYEMLTLTVVDAEEEQMWMAEIERPDGLPPRLKEWERLPKDVRLSGRFAGWSEILRA